MGFAKLCKRAAIVLLVLALIGSFIIAKNVSTTQEVYKSFLSSSTYTKDNLDSSKFFLVLVASWISSGILCLFIYGLGKIIEYLDETAEHLYDIKNKQNSIAKALEAANNTQSD